MTRRPTGHNPLCGDRLSITLRRNGDTLDDLRFEGHGCAISVASASMMTEAVKGKDRAAIEALFQRIHALLTDSGASSDGSGQAGGAVGSARISGAREVRQPVLAHPQRRAGPADATGNGNDAAVASVSTE